MESNKTNTNQDIQNFKKYQEQGAYHWITVKPSIKTTFNPYLHARYSVALENIPAVSGAKTAVDLGCGDGYIANQLGLKGYRVTGVDGSTQAIEHAKNLIATENQNKLSFIVGNVCSTPIESSSADLVITLDVIEHLDNPDLMLKEIERIAKPDATILIGTPLKFTEKPLDEYHVQEFFENEFKEKLENYFSVLKIEKSHPLEYVSLMRRKFNFLGKQKNIGWNLINLYYFLTGKNLFANKKSEFPTYQFALCKKN